MLNSYHSTFTFYLPELRVEVTSYTNLKKAPIVLVIEEIHAAAVEPLEYHLDPSKAPPSTPTAATRRRRQRRHNNNYFFSCHRRQTKKKKKSSSHYRRGIMATPPTYICEI